MRTCDLRLGAYNIFFFQVVMSRYMVTVSAVVEAEDEAEAEEVAQEIVNADLPERIEDKIESLHFHDGYGNVEITELR